MEWYLMVWRKYADFDGRARRKEFWMFQLVNCLIILSLSALGLAVLRVGGGGVGYVPMGVYMLAAIVPNLSVLIRRLHDSGKSAWFLLMFAVIGILPVVGGLVGSLLLIIFWCLDSDLGTNKYGATPKAFERNGPIGQLGQIDCSVDPGPMG